MNKKGFLQFIKNTLLRVILYLLIFIYSFTVILLVLLQFSDFQTFLGKEASLWLHQKTGYNYKVEKIHVVWYDELKLSGVEVRDQQDSLLLSAKSLVVDFGIHLFQDPFFTLDASELQDPFFNIYKDSSMESYNVMIFSDSIQKMIGHKTDTTSKSQFLLKNIVIHNGEFSFQNHQIPKDSSSFFDPKHFVINGLEGDLSFFEIFGDTIRLASNHLKLEEKHLKFPVHDYKGSFEYTPKSMKFDDFRLLIGESEIGSKFHMEYDSVQDLSAFFEKVNLTASLDSTLIRSSDMAVFIPQMSKYKDVYRVSGELSGKVNNIKLRNANVSFGQKESVLIGKISLEGLPNIKETFLDIDLKKSVIHIQDIAQYLGTQSKLKQGEVLGKIELDADFYGYPQDFVAHGDFQTALGYLQTDIKFNYNAKGQTTYEGKLLTKDFNIGKFINLKDLGKIDFAGEIHGKGLTASTAKVKLKAKASKLVYKNYSYKNIHADADLEYGFFSGNLSILDTNLNFTGNGTVDLRNNLNLFVVDGHLQKANLKEIKLSNDTFNITSKMHLNFSGLDLDSLEGDGTLSETQLKFKGGELDISDFKFSSHKTIDGRDFNVASEYVDLFANGNYSFRDLFSTTKFLVKEIKLFVNNDSTEIHNYYTNKKVDPKNFDIKYGVEAKDLSPLLSLVDTSIHISKSCHLEGNFKYDSLYSFEMMLLYDSLKYKDINTVGSQVVLDFIKHPLESSFKGLCYARSNEFSKGKIVLEEPSLSGTWDRNFIFFKSDGKQKGTTNAFDLNGKILFSKKGVDLRFNESSVLLANKKWEIDTGNHMFIQQERIDFERFTLRNKKEYVAVDGSYTDNHIDTVYFNTKNFELSNLNTLLGVNISGKVNGSLVITKDIEKIEAKSFVIVRDAHFKNEFLGDINGRFTWDSKKDEIDVNAILTRKGEYLTNLIGTVSTTENDPYPLDLESKFSNTDLAFLEPYFKGSVKNMGGEASGSVYIVGSFSDPNLYGVVDVKKGVFTVDYLNTTFALEDHIVFNEDSIYLSHAVLEDTLWKTKAIINGGVTHHLFTDFNAFFDIDLNKTLLFNTTYENNTTFYGTTFGTGRLSVSGSFDKLLFSSEEIIMNRLDQVESELVIPLVGENSLVSKNYIVFEGPKKRIRQQNKKRSSSNKILLDLNINIQPSLNVKLFMDDIEGDVLKANGNGKLKLVVDESGSFNVYGDYLIERGSYRFTLVHLPIKDFLINRGSSLSFKGDPYDGVLNVKASYHQNASIMPLMQQYFASSTTTEQEYLDSKPDVRKPIPVDVILNLKGGLLSPEIGFDISVTEYPNHSEVQAVMQDLKTRIRQNEQELNKQVFSLMLLKQFSPLQGVEFNALSGSASSVTEIFTAQLGSLLSQVDKNLIVDIDLSGFDDALESTANLSFTYSILEGRIRITRDGAITNVQSQDNINNLVGEWTIEYLLRDDGKLRLKAYNKNNQNVLFNGQSAGAGTSNSSSVYGISLTHTSEFDNLSEFFESIFSKKKKK